MQNSQQQFTSTVASSITIGKLYLAIPFAISYKIHSDKYILQAYKSIGALGLKSPVIGVEQNVMLITVDLPFDYSAADIVGRIRKKVNALSNKAVGGINRNLLSQLDVSSTAPINVSSITPLSVLAPVSAPLPAMFAAITAQFGTL